MKTLNIKDPEAHQIAEAIAKQTGESLTRVVTSALRERLEKINRAGKTANLEELRAIARRIGGNEEGIDSSYADLLYDERGLPK